MADSKHLSLVGHLAEFRSRLIASLIWFVLWFCLGIFLVYPFYHLVTQFLDQPLLALGPNEILWLYVKVASLVALSASLPFVTYQIWAYVKPALKQEELRAIYWYLPAVFLCFIMGLAFGFYLVAPALLQVLLNWSQELFETRLTVGNYLDFIFGVTLPLGFLFEMPVLVAFLTHIGLLSPKWLSAYRRYAYFVLLVLAVVLTPADFVSDLAMLVPLVGLYEISILISHWILYRKRRGGKQDGITS